jgi:hypothetical protein
MFDKEGALLQRLKNLTYMSFDFNEEWSFASPEVSDEL